jgi:hypothetical protein
MSLKPTSNKFYRRVLALAALLAVVAAIVYWPHQRPAVARHDETVVLAANPPVATAAVFSTNAAVSSFPSAAIASPPKALVATVQARPFSVGLETSHYQWTFADGKDTNVIRQLAHNELEYERMTNENSTIYRRQLVYHKAAFSLQAQATRLGQPLTQAVLPGLDGQELSAEIVKSELEAGGDRGVLSGHLAGRPDSMVTVAFIGGREAFTVVSPQDDLYLTAEPREPGEMVVKSFDPNTFAVNPIEDEPIVTTPGK